MTNADSGQNFFLRSVHYEMGLLMVTLEVGGEPYAELQFDTLRAFRSYSESDFYEYLSDFTGIPILTGRDADVGVFMSKDAPYVVEYRINARHSDPETTFSCLIATPQECVEVVCLEAPNIRLL